jgi:hypothetical protein
MTATVQRSPNLTRTQATANNRRATLRATVNGGTWPHVISGVSASTNAATATHCRRKVTIHQVESEHISQRAFDGGDRPPAPKREIRTRIGQQTWSVSLHKGDRNGVGDEDGRYSYGEANENVLATSGWRDLPARTRFHSSSIRGKRIRVCGSAAM